MKLEQDSSSSEKALRCYSSNYPDTSPIDTFPGSTRQRKRANTIAVVQSVQVKALQTRIKELESEIKSQRKRFWKTQDKNSQTHIQVKRRVSIGFTGAITAGKK